MTNKEETSMVVETVDCSILKSEGHGNRIKEEHVTPNDDMCSENNDEVPSPPAACSIRTTKPRQMSTLPSMRNLKDWTNERLFLDGMRGLPDKDYIPIRNPI